MTQSFYDDYDFDPEDLKANPYAEYEGTEDNMPDGDPNHCSRCALEYCASNIPNMLRCPGCGEYVEVIEDEDDGGAWDRSSRHRTRMEREHDDDDGR